VFLARVVHCQRACSKANRVRPLCPGSDKKTGLTVEAEDSIGLAQSILDLFKMPVAERLEMGRAGRTYYELHFEADKVLAKFFGILQSRMNCHG
jgi:hypothetical protein